MVNLFLIQSLIILISLSLFLWSLFVCTFVYCLFFCMLCLVNFYSKFHIFSQIYLKLRIKVHFSREELPFAWQMSSGTTNLGPLATYLHFKVFLIRLCEFMRAPVFDYYLSDTFISSYTERPKNLCSPQSIRC